MPRKNRKLDKPSKRRAWDKEVQIAKQKERELYRELAKMGPFTGEDDIDPDETDDDNPHEAGGDQETGT